mmetsp:Transcript_14527/g.41767  ORF Transcript_14527/g.41767 Transcript_14527/m.41767 type:complete len:316 (+) Transcript_14527:429-1376(+)
MAPAMGEAAARAFQLLGVVPLRAGLDWPPPAAEVGDLVAAGRFRRLSQHSRRDRSGIPRSGQEVGLGARTAQQHEHPWGRGLPGHDRHQRQALRRVEAWPRLRPLEAAGEESRRLHRRGTVGAAPTAQGRRCRRPWRGCGQARRGSHRASRAPRLRAGPSLRALARGDLLPAGPGGRGRDERVATEGESSRIHSLLHRRGLTANGGGIAGLDPQEAAADSRGVGRPPPARLGCVGRRRRRRPRHLRYVHQRRGRWPRALVPGVHEGLRLVRRQVAGGGLGRQRPQHLAIPEVADARAAEPNFPRGDGERAHEWGA